MPKKEETDINAELSGIRNIKLKHEVETSKDGESNVILSVSFEAKVFVGMGDILVAIANGHSVKAVFNTQQIGMEIKT